MVYHLVSVNGGRLGNSVGMSARGSPWIWQTMQNLLERSVRTGQTFRETGLYFCLVVKIATGLE